MARDLNHVTILGRLVRDPEIRYTASGTPVTKFSIANNSSFTVNNERKEEVNYFDVNVWGNQAVNCEKYLKKGSQVAIMGNLRQNRWTDKTTGQARSKVEITAAQVQFLTPVGGTVPGGETGHTGSTGTHAPNKSTTPPSGGGIIEDPWGDEGSTPSADEGYAPTDGDDDIPF